MDKAKASLKNWCFHPFYQSLVVGEVYGSVKFKDGDLITTSAVIKYDRENGVIETMNTIYQLVGKEVKI